MFTKIWTWINDNYGLWVRLVISYFFSESIIRWRVILRKGNFKFSSILNLYSVISRIEEFCAVNNFRSFYITPLLMCLKIHKKILYTRNLLQMFNKKIKHKSNMAHQILRHSMISHHIFLILFVRKMLFNNLNYFFYIKANM